MRSDIVVDLNGKRYVLVYDTSAVAHLAGSAADGAVTMAITAHIYQRPAILSLFIDRHSLLSLILCL